MVLLLILNAKPFLPSVQENLRVRVIHLHPEIKKKEEKMRQAIHIPQKGSLLIYTERRIVQGKIGNLSWIYPMTRSHLRQTNSY